MNAGNPKLLLHAGCASSLIKKFNFNTTSLLLVVFIFLLGAVFVLRPLWQIGGDGFGYYSYVRSAIFDGDFDLHNEFALFDSLYGHKTLSNWQTSTGQIANPFSIGPALLWFPFVALAQLVDMIFNFPDAYILSGFNLPFQVAVTLGTWFFCFLGLALIFNTLSKIIGHKYSWWAIVTAIAVSPLPYYLLFEPSMSHGLSIFSTGLFFYSIFKIYQRAEISWIDYLLLGLASGLLFLIRWQDIVLLIVAMAIIGQKIHQGKNIKKYLVPLLLAAGVFLITILPQLFMWRYIFGSWVAVPQGASFFQLDQPHIWEFLFSSYHGLLVIHPILFLSLVGLFLAWKKYKFLAIIFLLVLSVQVYLNAGLYDWYGGGSFGARRMVSSFFIFCFGFAYLFRQVFTSKTISSIIIFLVFLGFIFNVLLMMAYAKKIITVDSFTSYQDIYQAPLKVLKSL